MQRSNTILLAAGGTGGHIFPALALAETLRARGFDPQLITDHRFHHYTTSTQGVLSQIPIHTIRAGGLKGGLIKKAMSAAGIVIGIAQAAWQIYRLKPHAVVGFGGYPSFPTMLAAILMRRRTILHEQNAVLGRVNRVLAGHVSVIATTYPETQKIPSGLSSRFAIGDTGISASCRAAGIPALGRDDTRRIVHVGNPVRAAVQAVSQTSYPPLGPSDPFRVLVLGGSQGASIFSDVVPAALALLPAELRARVQLTQQCRVGEIEAVRARYQAMGMQVDLAPFFTDVAERLASSHLVISRAGASSIAELTVVGRPALLVPLPSAMDNHQVFNALSLADQRAAWLVTQDAFTPESLSARLQDLLEQPAQLTEHAAAMRALGLPNAADKLADVVVT